MSHGSHFLSVSCTSSRSMCYVSPLNLGANTLHQPVHLVIPGLLGPQWAIGATISSPDLAIYGRSVSPMSPRSYFISMVCTTSHGMHYASNRGQHLSKFYTSSHSGCSGSPVSRRSHCMSYIRISSVLDVLCPQSAHLTTMACVSSHSMCNVSPVSPGGHHTSTSWTSSHAGPSGAPVSPGSHYMNHIKIYPFSDVLCPHWALGATSCQCHIHIAVRCTMCPHRAPAATRT